MDWAEYYDKMAGRPPRPTLLKALEGFAEPGFAVDLGCGEGRDAGELLRRGWRVLALDRSAEAITRLPKHERLEARQADFLEVELPPADLVNASFTLFICPPDRFPALWAKIAAAIRPGGRFSGQFLGPRDSWLGREGMTFLTEAEARALFAGFELERFEEEIDDSVTPRGKPKRWHIWHVVARKLRSEEDQQKRGNRRRRDRPDGHERNGRPARLRSMRRVGFGAPLADL